MSRLKNKVALVTGGAQGLGLAIAERFAEEGADLAIVDLDPEKSEHAAEQCKRHGRNAISIVADLTDSAARNKIVSTVLDSLGEIDVLVNSAGIVYTRPLMEIDEASWRKVFDVNLNSAFFLMQSVAENMIQRGRGSIVQLTSNSAFVPKVEQVDYSASKLALVSLIRSAAMSLGPHGIRVNGIAPGVIRTPMTEQIARARAEIRNSTMEEMFKMFEPLTALKRLGSPEEVANAALFLASDESSYVTGQTLGVCGGLVMR